MKSKEDQYKDIIRDLLEEDFKILEPSDYDRVFVHNPQHDWGTHVNFFREFKITPFTITVEFEDNPVVGDLVRAKNYIDVTKHELNEVIINSKLKSSKKIYVIAHPIHKLNRYPFVKGRERTIYLDNRYRLDIFSEYVLIEVSESVYRSYGPDIVNYALVEHSYKEEAPEGSLNTFDKLIDML